jgi:sugar phosphate isomerase/epimerase
MFRDLSLSALGLHASQAEHIELALSYGFRGIDVDVVELHERTQSAGVQHARRLIDSAKVRLSTFALPFDPTLPDKEFREQLAKLKPLAETAAGVGCTRAVTLLAPGSDLRPYHENFEFHRQRYNEVAGALAPHGIQLGIGFCAAPELRQDKAFEFIHSLDALLLLLSMCAARNIGLVVDLWDVCRSGGQVDDLRKLRGKTIVQVRVSDAPADKPLDELDGRARLIPGETGTIDAAAALAILSELGYDGPVTPNPDRSHLPTGRDAVARSVGQGLDKVWKEAGLTAAGKLAASGKK